MKINKDTRNLLITVGVTIFLIFLMVLFAGRNKNRVDSSDTTPREAVIFVTPTTLYVTPLATPVPVESHIWIFQGFTGEKLRQNGFEYEYATFINKTSGTRVRAYCSAPNSPAPNQGAEYIWDKQTNILVPVVDNAKGDIQRFWKPEYIANQ